MKKYKLPVLILFLCIPYAINAKCCCLEDTPKFGPDFDEELMKAIDLSPKIKINKLGISKYVVWLFTNSADNTDDATDDKFYCDDNKSELVFGMYYDHDNQKWKIIHKSKQSYYKFTKKLTQPLKIEELKEIIKKKEIYFKQDQKEEREKSLIPLALARAIDKKNPKITIDLIYIFEEDGPGNEQQLSYHHKYHNWYEYIDPQDKFTRIFFCHEDHGKFTNHIHHGFVALEVGNTIIYVDFSSGAIQLYIVESKILKECNNRCNRECLFRPERKYNRNKTQHRKTITKEFKEDSKLTMNDLIGYALDYDKDYRILTNNCYTFTRDLEKFFKSDFEEGQANNDVEKNFSTFTCRQCVNYFKDCSTFIYIIIIVVIIIIITLHYRFNYKI